MLKRGYLFFVCVFILSPLLFFSSCEEVDGGTEKVTSKHHNEEDTTVKSKDKKEGAEKKSNDKIIGDILLDVQGIERINNNLVAINLYIENVGDEEEYVGGSFTAMETESNKVIKQDYPMEYDADDIINLSELPPKSKWSGKIFFKSTENKITLFYDNFLSGKKKFLLEIVN